MNGRRGQGTQDITCKINKPKMTLKTFCMHFLFKPVKSMDAIRVVQFLYYEFMMQILRPKPSSFCTFSAFLAISLSFLASSSSFLVSYSSLMAICFLAASSSYPPVFRMDGKTSLNTHLLEAFAVGGLLLKANS